MKITAFLFTIYSVFAFSFYELKKSNVPYTLVYADKVPGSYRPQFVDRVILMGQRLDVNPDWLMICMCFETGGQFRSTTTNRYSGAVGLIQFIPSTARSLKTTPAQLRNMTAVEQLDYVEKYFMPYRGRMKDVYDVYLVIFAPAFLGKPNRQVLYSSRSPTALGKRRYYYNRILDTNKDGLITISDVKKQIKRFVP